jgi:hypothetical protein
LLAGAGSGVAGSTVYNAHHNVLGLLIGQNAAINGVAARPSGLALVYEDLYSTLQDTGLFVRSIPPVWYVHPEHRPS